MPTRPKVSVLCLSYNQEAYIKQCIEGILSQKTNFEYEILINDDASNDGTREIIESYEKEHPSILKGVFHKENQYQKGKRNFLVRYLLPRVQGKYIAICEGDDFWTDPTKLQRQVDFLESHPEYALVFHPVKVHFEDGSTDDVIYPENKTGLNLERLLGENFIQTNSVMYRVLDNYQEYDLDVSPADWYLHLFHAQHGKIGFINRIMSVYRRHQGGIWWGSVDNEGIFLKGIFRQHMNLFDATRHMFADKKRFAMKINETEERFVKNAVSLNIEDIEFLREVARLTPRIAGEIIHEMHNLKVSAQARERDIWEALLETRNEAQLLINSKTYRTGKFIVIPVHTVKKLFKIK